MIRLFAILVRLFPRRFRERYGEELRVQLTRDHSRVRHKALARRVVFALRTSGDLLWNALAERVRPSTPPAPTTRFHSPTRLLVADWKRDLHHAIRRLARRPSFTLPAVATLTIGVGATTSIFSAINAALLRPLPYPEAEDIYKLGTASVDGGWTPGTTTVAEMAAIKSGAPSVVEVAGAGSSRDVIRTSAGEHRQVSLQTVTDGFFDVAGLPMELGSGSAIEALDGSFGAAVISYRTWDELFGRDPDIVGKTLQLAAGPATIVGVTASAFDLPAGTEVWLVDRLAPTSPVVFNGYLRALHGTGPERLRSELSAVMASRVDEGLDPGGNAFVVTPFLDTVVGDLRPILWIAMAAAAMVLALGCVNVASLMLARGGAQTREFAIRRAMGAGGGRIGRELLAEALLVSASGTVLGLLLACGGLKLLSGISLRGLPRLDDATIDANVLLAAVGVLFVAAVLVALLPLWRLLRLDVRALLGDHSRPGAGERASGRLLSGIVVAETALAIVLVTSAGWLVRSYANLTETDPGFASESRLVFRTALLGSSYMPIARIGHSTHGTYMVPDTSGGTPETWLRDLTVQLAELEEVRAVGLSSNVPFRTEGEGSLYVLVPGGEPGLARYRAASPDFFEALGVRLAEGRAFTDSDPETSVVVNEAFVRSYLGGRDPLGVTFVFGGEVADLDRERTIIGVAADVRYASLREPEAPAFYVRQYPATGFVVVSTSMADPTPLIPRVRDAVSAVDPGVPVTIEPIEDIMSAELARHRLGLWLMSLFAVASLLLAGTGIHGVVGYNTSLRSSEFGVRIAVGARPSAIAWSILVKGVALLVWGLLLGVLLAYFAGRLGSAWLYQVRAFDPLILTIAVFAVSTLTLVAFSIAALRGSRVEPGRVLKAE